MLVILECLSWLLCSAILFLFIFCIKKFFKKLQEETEREEKRREEELRQLTRISACMFTIADYCVKKDIR